MCKQIRKENREVTKTLELSKHMFSLATRKFHWESNISNKHYKKDGGGTVVRGEKRWLC